jgi:membrane fusion protein, multidrug efflux system
MSRLHLRWWAAALAFCVAAAAAVYAISLRAAQGQSAAPRLPDTATRAVPVVAARVRVGDMGVYLTGLGTATALQTVTVRSRVDGQLINVAFHEGQFVHQDDLLAELDPRPFQVQLTEAEGQAAKDEATLKNTQLDLSRYSDLFAKGLIPKQQLDTQAATLDQYEGGLKSDRGQIDSARLNLAYTRITAPISGRIGLRLVDPGNIVHATDQTGLVVITQIDPIGVLFTIPEDSLGQVLPHLRAAERLEVDAYDRDLKKKIAVGTLITVDNQIDQSTGTVKLKARFPNNSAALFPNQFVNARLLVNTIRRALIAPSAAVQLSPRSKFVYVVKPDSTVDARDVVVRLTEGDDTALASGVAAGDVVVTDGVDKLQQGTRVSAQIAPAKPDGEAVNR